MTGMRAERADNLDATGTRILPPANTRLLLPVGFQQFKHPRSGDYAGVWCWNDLRHVRSFFGRDRDRVCLENDLPADHKLLVPIFVQEISEEEFQAKSEEDKCRCFIHHTEGKMYWASEERHSGMQGSGKSQLWHIMRTIGNLVAVADRQTPANSRIVALNNDGRIKMQLTYGMQIGKWTQGMGYKWDLRAT